jgi:hypothetical protein
MKTTILPKEICIFNQNSNSIPETEESTLKFMWKWKRSQLAKAILNRKSNTGGLLVPDFKQYCRAITIKHHGTGP